MDTYAVPYSAFIIGFFELIAIAWVYGLDRHFANIHKMMGFALAPAFYWKILFKYACPAVIAGMLVAIIARFQPLKYNTYVYPEWADYAGWGMTLASVAMIPLYMLYQLVDVWTGNKSYSQIFRPDPSIEEADAKTQLPVKLGSQARLALACDQGFKGEINAAYIQTEFDSNHNLRNDV